MKGVESFLELSTLENLTQVRSTTDIPELSKGEPVRNMGGLVEKRTFVGLNKKPKSKVGWQEWHRKYALAFFFDQLDRVIRSASKKNYVMSLLTKWEKKFRAEYSRERPAETVANTRLVEDQINFVTEYVACAILDGTSKKNLNRIRHFLTMQSGHNIGERIELRFFGGWPIEAYAYVDSLKDVDIADVFFITNFESMIAYRSKLKNWTGSTAKRFLNEIKKDILFDMSSALFTVDPDDAVGLTEFEIGFDVDESDLNLNMLRCMPPSFVERFNPGRKKV